ncbi:P-loop NTPase [Candidatus Woesearchaeota archaeon]|nr:P-loop NTPase [Candidatus Woesearchaeota archaeon]
MTRFIALISGKGGTGKTTTSINLAHALTKLGKKTIVLDANFATPNLASHLGITSPSATLNEFLKKKKSLQETIHLHHSGLNFVPASISYQDFKKAQPDKITEIFEHLKGFADFVLVDCPAGLGYELVQILKNTDEALIIANPHLSSLVDALKSMELAQENSNPLPGFILNMTNKGKHELTPEEAEQTLNIPLLANIPLDKKIKKALHKHAPSHYLYPKSKSSKQYLKLAEYLINEKIK